MLSHNLRRPLLFWYCTCCTKNNSCSCYQTCTFFSEILTKWYQIKIYIFVTSHRFCIYCFWRGFLSGSNTSTNTCCIYCIYIISLLELSFQIMFSPPSHGLKINSSLRKVLLTSSLEYLKILTTLNENADLVYLIFIYIIAKQFSYILEYWQCCS